MKRTPAPLLTNGKLFFSPLWLIGVLVPSSACSNPSTTTAKTETQTEAPSPPAPKKTACPVKFIRARMVHNTEMDVYATVLNTSEVDISAIAFGAAHTDKFGRTWTPYKTDLSSEQTIKRGHTQSMHWEVLMEEPSTIQGKPDSSELYVTTVAFKDGRVLRILEIDNCSFTF